LLAALGGILAWIRKENKRVAVSALGVGIISAAWVYVVVAIVIAILLAILFVVISEGG